MFGGQRGNETTLMFVEDSSRREDLSPVVVGLKRECFKIQHTYPTFSITYSLSQRKFDEHP